MNREQLVVQAIEAFSLTGSDGYKLQSPECIQFVSPAIAQGAMNSVVRARFNPDEMDQRIAEILKPYEELGRNCWWMIGPNSTHREQLETKLIQRGFVLEHDAWGLAIETDRRMDVDVNPRITVERVSADSLDDFIRATREDGEVNDRYRSYCRWIMKEHGDRLELYLARVDGVPAGSGLIQLLDGTANLVSGTVRSPFRRQGAYRALVNARISRLRELGVSTAVVLSKAHTSAPILLRMGFEKVCSLRTLERVAQ